MRVAMKKDNSEKGQQENREKDNRATMEVDK
jgi:hypothetical protein